MTDCATTVIVPAHNEESVIERTLSALLRDARPGEFNVTVVCNGCDDRTADCVRKHFDNVNVIELSEASKTAAINAGLQCALDPYILLLDADIEINTAAARSLVGALADTGIEAAIGHMHIDTEGSSWPVRAFFRVWAEHPYLRNGKFAAAIAISKSALRRIGKLPDVIADDSYLYRLTPEKNIAVVDDVRFRVRVPTSLPTLIRVRSRIHRGNRELARLLPRHLPSSSRQAVSLLWAICRRPALWIDLPCYLAIGLASRLLAMTGSQTWERDLTSRQAV